MSLKLFNFKECIRLPITPQLSDTRCNVTSVLMPAG